MKVEVKAAVDHGIQMNNIFIETKENATEMVVNRPFILAIQHKAIKLPNLFFGKIASIN